MRRPVHPRPPLRRLAPVLILLAALPLPGGEPKLRRHEEWHRLLAARPTMRLAAATYFGAGGCECFAGGAPLDDGVLLYGNSWGPAFPGTPTAAVLGRDAPVDLPLRRPGMERGPGGDPLRPSPHHPNRTGFLVRFGPDLRTVAGVVRFGWAAATVDDALALPDGGVVIAGCARKGFAAAAGETARIDAPAGVDNVGAVVFEGVRSPGDTYVARLRPDLAGLAWAVLFRGHRRPPRLFADRGGGLVVDTRFVYRLDADGGNCERVPCEREIRAGGTRRLAGVSPRDGSLIFVGSRLVGDGRRRWLGPLVERCAPDGRPLELYYDWSAELVGHALVGLDAPGPIRAAAVGADGRVVLASTSPSARSVLLRNPLDLLAEIPHVGLGLVSAGDGHRPRERRKRRAERSILVGFTPPDGTDAVAGLWFGKDGYAPATAGVDGLAALPDGRVAIWGTSDGWLLQTTAAHFKAADQMKHEYRGYQPRRPKKDEELEPLAVGGRGPYLAVFNRDFTELHWSSAMARCPVAGVVAGPAGLVVAGTCLAPGDRAGVNRPAAVAAVQPDFGGGITDGHCYLLTGPEENAP